MTVIINTNVILPSGILFDGAVAFDGNKITKVCKTNELSLNGDEKIIDANGLYTAPGLIDIHNHGSKEHFFVDNPDACVRHFLSHGETTVLPTFYQTMSLEEMIEGKGKLEEFSKTGIGKAIKGIYMEGPYMRSSGSNQDKFKWSGDIDEKLYRPLVDAISNFVRVWAIDPARKNIAEFMQYVKKVDTGAIFSLGHSRATSEECEKVAGLGVKLQTHHGDSGSAPRINQARCGAGCDEFTLLSSDMYAEIIADEAGIHLSPYTIRAVINAKGIEKIILITDSYPAEGDYKNNEAEGIKYGSDLNYDKTGWLAGSHLTLDKAIRNVMSYTGYGLSHAVRFASLNPARLLGIDSLYGSVEEGKIADLLLVDDRFNVKSVFLEGEEIGF